MFLLLNQKPNQGGIGMADVNATVQNACSWNRWRYKGTYCAICIR